MTTPILLSVLREVIKNLPPASSFLVGHRIKVPLPIKPDYSVPSQEEYPVKTRECITLTAQRWMTGGASYDVWSYSGTIAIDEP